VWGIKGGGTASEKAILNIDRYSGAIGGGEAGNNTHRGGEKLTLSRNSRTNRSRHSKCSQGLEWAQHCKESRGCEEEPFAIKGGGSQGGRQKNSKNGSKTRRRKDPEPPSRGYRVSIGEIWTAGERGIMAQPFVVMVLEGKIKTPPLTRRMRELARNGTKLSPP